MATNGTLLAILKQQLDILDTRDRPPAIINTDSHGLQTLSITFPNLIAKALDVAKHFRERVPQTNDRTEENKRVIVAVYFERSPEYIISILGCIIAGAVFMPLSPEWPQAFLISKIKEAKPSIIVRRASSLTREGQSIEECIPSDCQHIIFEDFIPYAQENPSNMEDLKNSLETAQHLYGNKDIAYLMFTSGSTGQPKQVLGTYEGLLNRVNWMSSKYPFQPGDKVCFKTPIIFVDSIWEIFGPLLAGVPLVVASQKLIRNGKEFVDFLSNQKITHLTAVPTHLQNLHVHFSGNQGLKLKQLVSSGESMTPELLKNLQRVLHDTRILNLYGCTEAAGDSLCFDATKFHTESGLLRSNVPLGLPISRTAILLRKLLDDDRFPGIYQSENVGEICILGKGLCVSETSPEMISKGDLMISNKDILKAPDFEIEEKNRLLATGDVGRVTENGIEILGRIDHQVKVAGMRVNLLEIETMLLILAEIENVAVKCFKTHSGSILVAFVVLSSLKTPDLKEIRDRIRGHCEKYLPAHTIPHQFEFLKSLPILASGKVDRQSLVLPLSNNARVPDSWSSGQISELAIVSIFREALLNFELEPTEDFWKNGGDSLMAMQVANRLQIPVELLYTYKTPRKLSHHLGEKHSSGTQRDRNFEVVPSSELTDTLLSKICPNPIRSVSLMSEAPRLNPKRGGFILTFSEMLEIRKSNNTQSREEEKLEEESEKKSKQFSMNAQEAFDIFQHPELRTNSHQAWLDDGKHDSKRRKIDEAAVCQTNWSYRMKKCVDASPIVVMQTGFTDIGDPNKFGSDWWIFACSDGGEIVCIHGPSGILIWNHELQGRADHGLLGMQNLEILAVSSDKSVHFLDTVKGEEKCIVELEGAVRCPPSQDPLLKYIFVTSHSPQTLVIDWERSLSLKLQTKSPSSIPAVFDPGGKLVYIVSLSGLVSAFKIEAVQDVFETRLGSESASRQPTNTSQIIMKLDEKLEPIWTFNAENPVLSKPTIIFTVNHLIVATVCGDLFALNREGIIQWQISLESDIYSPILCNATEGYVIIFSKNFEVFILEGEKGLLVERSTADIKLGQVNAVGRHHILSKDAYQKASSFLIQTSQNLICEVRIERQKENQGKQGDDGKTRIDFQICIEPLASTDKLSFSSPVAFDDKFVFGCRDDNLYCCSCP